MAEGLPPAAFGPIKVAWSGVVRSVQPRIRLTRSFDERQHSYLGYVLHIDGKIADEDRDFTVGVGKAAHAKHGFRVGDRVSGKCVPVRTNLAEPAEYYKTSALRLERDERAAGNPPPWHHLAPLLEEYRQRGHRRLAARTYETSCSTCTWGARMAVEIIVDHWKPDRKKYRTETFCYGPLSCGLYKAGPTRKVPGRRGMSYEEEDWIDGEATNHRSPDE
ncbi:MAG: hypothetical protein GY725_05785 [bacterium]|nr:hypothetical protein [bacterium]